LQKHELISSNINYEFERDRAFGEKIADQLHLAEVSRF